MKKYNADNISGLEKRFRANLINSITGFKSANLIGTVSEEGVSNLAVFSSVVHIGAHPPLIGFIMRPLTVERQTYENIIRRKKYTINSLPFTAKEDGHMTSAKFDAAVSEFDHTNFTSEFNEFGLPYVQESPVCVSCNLKSDTLIEINQTRLIVGEIEQIRLNPEFLQNDGFFDLASAGSACISGMDSYHAVNQGTRFAYARPGEETKVLRK